MSEENCAKGHTVHTLVRDWLRFKPFYKQSALVELFGKGNGIEVAS